MEIVKEFQVNASDTGSAGVKIGLLSEEIKDIENNLWRTHDMKCRLILLRKVGERRKLLNYLKNTDVDRYLSVKAKIDKRRN